MRCSSWLSDQTFFSNFYGFRLRNMNARRISSIWNSSALGRVPLSRPAPTPRCSCLALKLAQAPSYRTGMMACKSRSGVETCTTVKKPHSTSQARRSALFGLPDILYSVFSDTRLRQLSLHHTYSLSWVSQWALWPAGTGTGHWQTYPDLAVNQFSS
jgi:hypothetical protein